MHRTGRYINYPMALRHIQSRRDFTSITANHELHPGAITEPLGRRHHRRNIDAGQGWIVRESAANKFPLARQLVRIWQIYERTADAARKMRAPRPINAAR